MTALRLFYRQLRADIPVLLTVGLLVFASAVLAAAVPRQLNETLDAALVATVAEAPAPAREVRASTLAAISSTGMRTVDEEIATAAPPALSRALQPAHRAAATDPFFALDADTGQRFFPREQSWLQVRYQSQLGDRVRWVQGRAPAGPSTLSTPMGPVPLIEVAFSDTAAATMGITAGQQILLDPIRDRNLSKQPIGIHVTGIFQPLDPTAAYWSQDRYLLTPGEERDRFDQLVAYLGVAVTSDEAAVDVVLGATTVLRYEWHYPVALTASTADQPQGLSAAIEDLESVSIKAPQPPSAEYPVVTPRVRIQSGLPEVLQDYQDEAATARSVSSLMLVGLVVLAIAVLVIAARLSVDRRAAAVALARARGCSGTQVTGAFLLLAMLVAVPTAGAGYLAAVGLVPGRGSELSLPLVAVLTAACVGLLTAYAGMEYRHSDIPATGRFRTAARRRVAAELLVLIVAGAGVLLLRRRGLATAATSTGTDPFLAAVPVLLGLAAGIVALRLYPLPLLPLTWLTHRRRGIVAFMGLASASRAPLRTAMPLVVLLLALGFSVFASIVEATVREGQAATAWQRVGADYRLASYGFTVDQIDSVRAVPGVTSVVPAYTDERARLATGRGRPAPVRLLAVDPERYAGLLEGSGIPPSLRAARRLSEASGRLPALVGPGAAAAAAADGGEGTIMLSRGLGERTIRVAAFTDVVPSSNDQEVVIVPLEALQASGSAPLPTTELLLRAGPAAGPVLAETVAGFDRAVRITSRPSVYAALSGRPLVEGTVRAFRLGVVAAAGYCLVAVLLTMVLTARPRGRLLSYLRTLGLTSRQAGGLLVLEFGPLLAVAVLAGVAFGMGLPHLVGPALDLRPFTGGELVPALHADVPTVLGLGGGLTAAGAMGAVAAAIGRHRRLGRSLRVGENT